MKQILSIVTYPDPILRNKSVPVEHFDEELQRFLSEMAKVMYKYDGIGLAAPQVGVNKRIVVVDVGKGLLKLVNPQILEVGGQEEEMEEGCLSLPGVYVPVKRKIGFVKFSAFDALGRQKVWTARGLLARVIQHELDHLDGILIIDRAERQLDSKSKENLKQLEVSYGKQLSQ